MAQKPKTREEDPAGAAAATGTNAVQASQGAQQTCSCLYELQMWPVSSYNFKPRKKNGYISISEVQILYRMSPMACVNP